MHEELSVVLTDYAAGLDHVLLLLTRLEALAERQRAMAPAPAADSLEALVAERQHVLDALLALDTRLRPLRERIGDDLTEARTVPGFAVVAERHRAAAAAVTRIVQIDQHSLDALQFVGAQRRQDAQAMETAGTTLAAYRRVLSGPRASAGLVDERG